MAQNIIVLTEAEDHQRKFYVPDVELIDRPFAIFRQPVLPEDEQLFAQMGETGGKIAFAIMQIDGVEHVKLEKESLKVKIGYADSWRYIQGQILDVLKDHLGKLEVAYDYLSMMETTATKISA